MDSITRHRDGASTTETRGGSSLTLRDQPGAAGPDLPRRPSAPASPRSSHPHDRAFGRPRAAYLVVEAVVALVRRLATARPLALVVEDLHWADPATLVALGSLARRLRRRLSCLRSGTSSNAKLLIGATPKDVTAGVECSPVPHDRRPP